MIYTRCARCGKRIQGHARCECLKARHKEYDRLSRDAKSKAYYNSSEWDIARAEALEADAGIDVYLFMTEGTVKYADTVHHIVPLRQDWSKRAAVDNLMSLHHDTHSLIEKKFYGKNNNTTIIETLTKMLKEYRAGQGAGVAQKV